MGLNFLKTLVYSSKYAKHKSCAGGAAGAHVAVRDPSVEKTVASHAHAICSSQEWMIITPLLSISLGGVIGIILFMDTRLRRQALGCRIKVEIESTPFFARTQSVIRSATQSGRNNEKNGNLGLKWWSVNVISARSTETVGAECVV